MDSRPRPSDSRVIAAQHDRNSKSAGHEQDHPDRTQQHPRQGGRVPRLRLPPGRHRARTSAQDIRARPGTCWRRSTPLLETHGTDNTRLLQALIWLKDIRDREAMNGIWTAWLPSGAAPGRACVQSNMADPRVLVEIMITACK